MTTPLNGPELHLPHTAADLADFAHDIREFNVANVAHRVGVRAVLALEREDPIPARLATRGGDALGVLIRLFLLGCSISDHELKTALPTSWHQAQSWGILTGGNQIRANIDLRPTTIGADDAWLAADLGETATEAILPTDHVLGLGGASATLVRMTVRPRVERALDVGTGAGIQTLGLATHAETVVATDISSRALQFAAFNMALNDAIAHAHGRESTVAQRVRLEQGSFFDPVQGTFDLIVSNPPFVVSPRTTSMAQYTYRDGGYEGDGVVRYLVENIPTYLRPGGVGQILANWEIHDGQDWQERIESWVQDLGVDAWVIMRERVDPAHYVHTWIRDGGLTPDRDRATYESTYMQWLADFDARGVSEVAFGYVILRKPLTQRDVWIRCEEVTGSLGEGLGETILATLDMVDTLFHTTDEELLTWRLVVGQDVTEERYHRPGEAHPTVILARQGGGLGRVERLDTLSAAAMGACDGELDVGTICQAVAQVLELDVDEVTHELLPTMRDLLVGGFVMPTRQERDTLNP